MIRTTLNLLILVVTGVAMPNVSQADVPSWEDFSCEKPLVEVGKVQAGTVLLATRWSSANSCYKSIQHRFYLRDDSGIVRKLFEFAPGMNCSTTLENVSIDDDVLSFVHVFQGAHGTDGKTGYAYEWLPTEERFEQVRSWKFDHLTEAERVFEHYLDAGRLVPAAMVRPDWYADRYDPELEAHGYWKRGAKALAKLTRSVPDVERDAMWEWFAQTFPHRGRLVVEFNREEKKTLVYEEGSPDEQVEYPGPGPRPTASHDDGVAAVKKALEQDRLDLAAGHFLRYGLADHDFSAQQYRNWVQLVHSWALEKYRLGNACVATAAMEWLVLDRESAAPWSREEGWRKGAVRAVNDAAFFAQHCPLSTLDVEERVEHLERIVRARPKRAVAWLNLADARLEDDTSRTVEAMEAFRKYVDLRKAAGKSVPDRVTRALQTHSLGRRADDLLHSGHHRRHFEDALDLYRLAATTSRTRDEDVPARIALGAAGKLHLRHAELLHDLGYEHDAKDVAEALKRSDVDIDVPEDLLKTGGSCYGSRHVAGHPDPKKLKERSATLRDRRTRLYRARQGLAIKKMSVAETRRLQATHHAEERDLQARFHDVGWWVGQLPNGARASARKTWYRRLRSCFADPSTCD